MNIEDDPVAMALGFVPVKPGVRIPGTPEHCHRCALDALAEWEAIRQTVPCPSCNGVQTTGDIRCRNCGASASLPLGMTCNDHRPTFLRCPDCTDGKIPMARLLAVGAAVFNAEYMNRNQAGEWRPVIVNALPSGSPRAAVFAEQLLDYLLQVRP